MRNSRNGLAVSVQSWPSKEAIIHAQYGSEQLISKRTAKIKEIQYLLETFRFCAVNYAGNSAELIDAFSNAGILVYYGHIYVIARWCPCYLHH